MNQENNENEDEDIKKLKEIAEKTIKDYRLIFQRLSEI